MAATALWRSAAKSADLDLRMDVARIIHAMGELPSAHQRTAL